MDYSTTASYDDWPNVSNFGSNSATLNNYVSNINTYYGITPTTTVSVTTVSGVTYNVYIYFLIMEQNTFTNNYGGYELGVVTIMGAHFF